MRFRKLRGWGGWEGALEGDESVHVRALQFPESAGFRIRALQCAESAGFRIRALSFLNQLVSESGFFELRIRFSSFRICAFSVSESAADPHKPPPHPRPPSLRFPQLPPLPKKKCNQNILIPSNEANSASMLLDSARRRGCTIRSGQGSSQSLTQACEDGFSTVFRP